MDKNSRVANSWKLLAGAVLKRAILDGEKGFTYTDYGQSLVELSGLKITDFSEIEKKSELAKELNKQRSKLAYYRKVGNTEKADETRKIIEKLKKEIDTGRFSNFIKNN